MFLTVFQGEFPSPVIASPTVRRPYLRFILSMVRESSMRPLLLPTESNTLAASGNDVGQYDSGLLEQYPRTARGECSYYWLDYEGHQVTLNDMVLGYADHLELHMRQIHELAEQDDCYRALD